MKSAENAENNSLENEYFDNGFFRIIDLSSSQCDKYNGNGPLSIASVVRDLVRDVVERIKFQAIIQYFI